MCTYGVYKLTVHSELRLPELEEVDASPDVLFRFGPVDFHPAELQEEQFCAYGTTQDIRLYYPEIGKFHVRSGCEVVIDPLPGVIDCSLRLILLGSALGILLLQRGLMVFHSSVIKFPSGAAAFLAPKGYGKSTLAAALNIHGYDLVADDIMALDVAGETLLARPGFPQIKLWPDAANAIVESPDPLPKLHPDYEKLTLRSPEKFSRHCVRLLSVFVFDIHEQIEIVPLDVKHTWLQVIPHWYGAQFDGKLLQAFGLKNHFAQCATLVQRVPVYVIRLPRSLKDLREVALAIERHMENPKKVPA